MSDELKGTTVVEYVGNKNGIYSIKGSDGEWYGCYKTDPKCEKGDEIEFDYKVQKGYNNVIKGTVKVIGKTEPAEQPSSDTGGSGAPKSTYNPSRSNDVYDNASYWKAKTDHDMLHTQFEIRNAAARKMAVETILGVLSAGHLELPETKKKGAKLDAVITFINKLTVQFCDECEEYVDMQNQEAPEEGGSDE